MNICPRCCKNTDEGCVHTCTPTTQWREIEKQRDDLLAALELMAYYAQPKASDTPELCGFEAQQGDKNFIRAVAAITAVRGAA
jgi:hypothetical protein